MPPITCRRFTTPPVPVEEQIILIYAGTRGYLDKIEVGAVGRYERELVAWLRAKKADLLSELVAKKDIGKDGLEDKVKAALNEFASAFAA